MYKRVSYLEGDFVCEELTKDGILFISWFITLILYIDMHVCINVGLVDTVGGS